LHRTAADILSAVQGVISKYNTTSVVTVGHGLGAALSLLDSIYLRLQLPGDVRIHPVLHGLPRVGNREWAGFVDPQMLYEVKYINNKHDPVPILAPLSKGYHNPSGEIHIGESEQWYGCLGQDNPSDKCIVGAVPNMSSSNPMDHFGPYDGVFLTCNGLPIG